MGVAAFCNLRQELNSYAVFWSIVPVNRSFRQGAATIIQRPNAGSAECRKPAFRGMLMSRIRIALALLVCVFVSLGAPAVAALV